MAEMMHGVAGHVLVVASMHRAGGRVIRRRSPMLAVAVANHGGQRRKRHGDHEPRNGDDAQGMHSGVEYLAAGRFQASEQCTIRRIRPIPA
jgi:hypothetical protein